MPATGFWDFLPHHLLGTTAVAGFAFLIRWITATSPKNRIVGWVTFALCVGGYFCGGLIRRMTNPDSPSWPGYAMLGMAFGTLSGVVLGRFVWRYYAREFEDDTEAEDV